MRGQLKVLSAFAVLTAFLILGVALAGAAAPTVTLEATTAISFQSAKASGHVDPADHEASYRFQYVTQSQFDEKGFQEAATVGEGSLPENAGSTAVSADLEGLVPGTAYRLRLLASNGEGQEALATDSFTTQATAAPTVSILAPTAITGTAAHFEGEVNPEGTDPAFNVNWRFECAPACPGLEGTIDADASAHTVEADATGLKPGTAYEVSLVAANAGAQASAGPESFSTATLAPQIKSSGAGPLSTEATLVASINPGGLATSYHFEYGPTAAYGQSTAAQTIPAGGAPVTVKATVFGLTPNSGYHFRVVASNAVGAVEGPDRSFTTTSQGGGQDSCPNAAIRAEQGSAFLPECRAYEQVSPQDKNGGMVYIYGGGVVGPRKSISRSGDRVVYDSYSSFFGTSGAFVNTYYGARTASGWTTTSVTPPAPGETSANRNAIRGSQGASADGKALVLKALTPLTPGAPSKNQESLYSWTQDGELEWISRPEPDGANEVLPGSRTEQNFLGSSTDGSRLFFSGAGGLVPPISGGPQLAGNSVYERSNGKTYSVATDSSGAFLSQCGSEVAYPQNLGPNNEAGQDAFYADTRAVADDGSVAFIAPERVADGDPSCDEVGKLYVRNANRETVEVSKPQGDLGQQSHPPVFQWMSHDGKRVLFSSPDQLTDDPAPVGGLYAFDLPSQSLTLLYALPNENVPVVLGASEDGARVYFGFPEPLAPGAAEAGRSSLYLLEGGELSLVAKSYDAWVQVSPDGQKVALTSPEQLTSYDNNGIREVYLYGNQSESLTCVSCRGDGLAPTAESNFGRAGVVQERRNLSLDGRRLVFESKERLLPDDSNGSADVYMYVDGELHLLTRGDNESVLLGASETGDDVFVGTTNPLLASDRDGATDLYDVRVDGGFRGPVAPRPPCAQDGCQGPTASAPIAERAASATYRGPANQKARKHHRRHHRRGMHHKKRSQEKHGRHTTPAQG